MKKSFLILLLFSMSFITMGTVAETVKPIVAGITELHDDASTAVETVYNDSKSVVTTAYTDVKDMVTYITPKVEAGITALAESLSTTAEEVFKILVTKQIALAVLYLFFGILASLFGYMSYKIIKLPDNQRLNKKPKSDGDITWKDQWILSMLFTVAAMLTFLVLFITYAKDMILGFVAPKYGAIQEIIQITETLLGN